jgi:hypothetical protein
MNQKISTTEFTEDTEKDKTLLMLYFTFTENVEVPLQIREFLTG